MNFIWPQSFWLLLLAPAIAAGYRRVVKRNGSTALRHVPPALFAVAMMLLLTATARPTALLVMPKEARTVILAIDVSGSMRADDVVPTRLAAAQTAARDFVNALPSSVRVGVVAFTDEAHLVQAPVASREDVLFAVDSLRPLNGTAIGSGILASLDAIPAETPAAVILLTDGQNSQGPDPMEAARLAAGRGVRVYTVGVGTEYGQIHDERGWRMTVGIDEDALKAIAELTGSEYFYAGSAPDLEAIYAGLGAKVVLDRIRTEISALLCAFAALAAIVSAAMSLVWFGRVL
jgi:Ca-activated chloride channel family protein